MSDAADPVEMIRAAGRRLYDRSVPDTERTPFADDIFDHWHDAAAAHVRAVTDGRPVPLSKRVVAGGEDEEDPSRQRRHPLLPEVTCAAVAALSGSGQPGCTRSRDATSFLLHATLGLCAKIFDLAREKPKVAWALFGQQASETTAPGLLREVRLAFEEWTGALGPHARADPGAHAERLSAAAAAVRLETFLAFPATRPNRSTGAGIIKDSPSESSSSSSAFEVPKYEPFLAGSAGSSVLATAALAAVGRGADEITRGAAAALAEAFSVRGGEWRRAVIDAAAGGATDHAGLARLWSWGALADSGGAVAAVEARAVRSPEFAREVMSSLRDALLDDKRGKGGANHGSSSALSSEASIAGAVRLLKVCDATVKSEHKEEDERADDTIQLAGMLLALAPSNGELLAMLTSEPVTVESVGLLAGASSLFPQEVWIGRLLPWIGRRIDAMGIEGVSGDRVEQEIIDLLRDCAREFYIDAREEPIAELGAALFRTIVNAMRHGYIETERFPYLAARVLAWHASSESSAAWLDPLLDPRVCRGRKLFRAVSETIANTAGLSGSLESTGGDALETSPELKRSVLSRVVGAISGSLSPIAARIIADAVQTRPGFVSSLGTEADADVFIRNVADAVNAAVAAIARGARAHADFVPAVLRILSGLSLRASPRCAPVLFDTTLRVITFASGSMAQAGVATTTTSGWAQHFGDVGKGGAGADETLARLVDRIPPGAQVPPRAVEAALGVGGAQTRAALTRMVPHLLLRDLDANVREAALVSLSQRRTDLIAVIVAGGWQGTSPNPTDLINATFPPPSMTPGDGPIRCDLDLIIAAGPALTQVGISHPPSLPGCAARLAEGVRLSGASSLTGLPDKGLFDACDAIGHRGDAVTFSAFLVSARGRRAAGTARKYKIPSWLEAIARLEAAKVLTQFEDGYQLVDPHGMGAGVDEPLLSHTERADAEMERARRVVTSAVGDAQREAADACLSEFELCVRQGKWVDACRAARGARSNMVPERYAKCVAPAMSDTVVAELERDPSLTRSDLADAISELAPGSADYARVGQRLLAADITEVNAILREHGKQTARGWVNEVNPPHAAVLHAVIENGGRDTAAYDENAYVSLDRINVTGGNAGRDDWDLLAGSN